MSDRARATARGATSPAWLWLSLLLLAGQWLGGLLAPHAMVVTTIGLGGQTLLIGIFALCQCRSATPRGQWWLLAMSMLLWAAGYVAIFVEVEILRLDGNHAQVDSLFFMARGVVLLVVITGLGSQESRRAVRLDVGQAMLLLLTTGLLLFGPFWAGGEQRATDIMVARYREVQNLAQAVLALVAARLSYDRPSGRLFVPLAWLLCGYAAFALLVNRLVIEAPGTPPATPWLTLVALPGALFFISAGKEARRPRRAPRGRLGEWLRMLAPTTMAAGTMASAFVLAVRGDARSGFPGLLPGAVLGSAAMMLYSLRAAAVQLQQRATIRDLEAAHARATNLSLTDPLTGLGNRRQLEAVLPALMQEAGGGVAVLMIDADWFKLYNDRQGHAAGDTALCAIAAELVRLCPDGGTVVRQGGEEFLLVTRLPDMAAARALAEALRAAIAGLRLPHPASPFGLVTISIGAAWQAMPVTPNRLFALADRALYAAKGRGRNRVGLAEADLLAA